MKFIEKKNAAQSTGGKAKKLQSALEKYSNSKMIWQQNFFLNHVH